jgi:hypothetical protein
MKLALPALIGAAGLLAACADDYPPPPPLPVTPAAAVEPMPVGGCFRTQDIANHTIGDDRTLYLRINSGDVFRVEMTGACLAGAASDDPLVIRSPPGTPVACRAVDLDISITKGGLATGIPTPCIVSTMTALTPAEVAVLPSRLVP